MSAALPIANTPSAPADGTIRLPLSGTEVRVRAPTGIEDLMLVENDGTALQVSLQLMQNIVRGRDGSVQDLAALSLHDLDALLLRLRQSLLGDRIETDATCPSLECGSRMDVSFEINEYLNHHCPLRVPWKSRTYIAAASEADWFRLTRRADGHETAQFRLPTARDVLDLQHTDAALQQLSERCIRPTALRASERHAVEAAMEAIAPNLSSDLQGKCPECGNLIRVAYEPRSYCIAEFRQLARFVIEEVDLLAHRYHWSESEILAMPNRRRSAYAELARESRGIV
jgi:hypothetical protein